MDQDRITQIRVKGLRVIEDLALDLCGLTVLIGDNGSGKSSILDAFELLRLSASPINFVTDVIERAHGGLKDLLGYGAKELTLGVTVEGEGPKLEYDFSIAFVGTSAQVVDEKLQVYEDTEAAGSMFALIRKEDRVYVLDPSEEYSDIGIGTGAPVLEGFDVKSLVVARLGLTATHATKRVLSALSRIEYQAPWETRPLWQQSELSIKDGPRWPSVVEQSERVARYGFNLPNCYQQLRNRGEVWSRVLEQARFGLGDDFRDFRLTPAGRGNLELDVVFGSAPDTPVPVRTLSEGQLSYLLFIALVELNQQRSALVVDEPELHLHPALLARVVWMLEAAAERCPVVIATHSDRLLDALASPEKSVVLCELDDHRATRVRRPNAERLAQWLEDYRGLGTIRSEGYEDYAFDSDPTPSASSQG